MLHAAPLGFDASTLELWGPLLNGGCVVVHDEQLPTGAGLEATIRRHGVTTAWLTAALFNAVVDEDPRRLSGLQRSEEHTSELQSLMRISYAVFGLKTKKRTKSFTTHVDY